MSNIFLRNTSGKVRHFIDRVEVLIKGTKFEGKVFVVGGAVRDTIIGKNANDVDIAVEMENGGVAFANWLAEKDGSFRFGSNPVTFERYGTAKVCLSNDKECSDLEVECVQTRKERYDIESRKPHVEFGTIEEDANRRDFTCNALYYNISSRQIIDVLGTSIEDIQYKILRTPLNSDETFSEDPLRMLRAIRFSVKLGWGIDKYAWMGILNNAHRISIVSKERIRDEFTKILLCDKPSEGINKLRYSGLLELIARDIYDLKDYHESLLNNVTYYDHTMKVLDDTMPLEDHRLAALFHDVGSGLGTNEMSYNEIFSAEIAKSDLEKMKYPNSTIKSVVAAITLHNYFKGLREGNVPSDKRVRKFMDKCGDDLAITLDLMNANSRNVTYGAKKRLVPSILDKIESFEKEEGSMNVKLPINGNDIMREFKLKPSAIIGKLLDTVKDKYFENTKITREECMQVVKEELEKIA